MIYLCQSIVDRIISQGKDHLPIECCGLLAGQLEGDKIEIVDVYSMINVDQSPEHFSLDPKEQLEAYHAIRNRGLKMLGNYHSHPSTPARPSQEDIRLAYDPKAIYMILSLAEKIPVLKAFTIQDGQYSEIPISIKETE